MTIISKTSTTAHIRHNGKNYLVSDNGSETLIFPSDTQGNVTNWLEVGGGRGYTLDQVLQNFSSYLM